MLRSSALLILVISMLGTPAGALADNWPQWRGPNFNGVAPGEGYPVKWGPEENVVWKASLPGRSGSTPAVWGNRIFVSSPGDGRNLLLCFDRDGQELWRADLGAERPGKHRKGSGSNPSPTTDGEIVIAYYKSGDLAGLDFHGNVVWRKNLQHEFGEDTLWWDLGTSPVLVENAAVVACMQSDNSYIAALDKLTGGLLWKVDRNLPAPNEANQSYSTPIPVKDGDRTLLVALGADHLTAHDLSDGHEVWRMGNLNPDQNGFGRSIASPVLAGDIIVAPYERGESLYGVRLGGAGDVTGTHLAWKRKEFSSDVPTPAALGERVFVCTDRGVVACVHAQTGDAEWSNQPEKHRDAYSSSPVVAEGRVHVTREDGTTYVLSIENRGELLAKNEIGERTLATPVFVDGRILLRTEEHLYCLGESP